MSRASASEASRPMKRSALRFGIEISGNPGGAAGRGAKSGGNRIFAGS